MSDTRITRGSGRMTVTTGELVTCWKVNDDYAAADRVSTLHEQIERLRAALTRIREHPTAGGIVQAIAFDALSGASQEPSGGTQDAPPS